LKSYFERKYQNLEIIYVNPAYDIEDFYEVVEKIDKFGKEL